ncbi:hypothetical protein D5S18_10345 [Nocardia panacis]|uniref:DUF732 domain-containing protein n=1 Tax=Nocardia panacis TaxID=2340916 RepID=A0A3A4KT40_9NOCA|nr:hypothetical protein [Nocardia panacis]RJO76666.1 hypothetical protein D5S18_10345 [Nocardia panacis]
MKPYLVTVLAAGALAAALAGCGKSTDNSTDANGLRTPGASSGSASTPKAGSAAASKITCGEFKSMNEAAEKSVIEQILAEHPDSSFAGSPNVALGTAKLVCLSASAADTPVAVAAKIVGKTG